MTQEPDAFQTVLSDADELLRARFRELAYPDTPFVVVAVRQDNQLVIRGSMSPAGLRELAEDLIEAAEEAGKWPANDGD